MEKNSKIFKKPSSFDIILRRGVWSRAHIILIREEDDFDQNDDDASFWERCFFCCWSDESEELY
jgi:hypothetical protein